MIEIDRDACLASGLCSFYAPEVFGQDTEGKAVVLVQPLAVDDTIREAVAACPVSAIRISWSSSAPDPR